MRCPKCGYTSFDHLESCKKCHKSFGTVSEELNGTTYEAVAPLFFQITRDLEPHSAPDSVQPLDFDDIDLDDDNVEESESPKNDLRPGIDTEFTLEEELLTEATKAENSTVNYGEELIIDLDDFDEVTPEEELSMDFEPSPEAEEKAELPPIDFSDLDISDLGAPIPPETLEEDQISFPQEQLLSDLEASFNETEISEEEPPDHRPLDDKNNNSRSGLEDLNFNGLDLESPSKIVSGSVAGKRYLPTVKTGTALDKFDIDLGELFKDNKK